MATIYRNRQLTYLSVILFFYFASIGCLAPFLTSHMRGVGFSVSEISFINAVAAFLSLPGPVLFGALAERRHRYKSATSLCMLVGALAFVGLSFAPRYQKLHYRPLVDFECGTGLRVERCVNWATCAEALAPEENYTTFRLSECQYRCRARGGAAPPIHVCFHGAAGNLCAVYDPDVGDDSLTEFQSQLHSWPFREVPFANATNVTEEDVPRAHVAMCHFLPRGPIAFGRNIYQGISCRPHQEDCSVHCKVTFLSGANEVPQRSCEEATGDPTTTFWTYLVLRTLADLCVLTSVCLLDAWTLWSTVDYEGAYGRLHVWAALGVASLAPFSGALLDHSTDADGRADLSPSAFLSAAFALLTCVLVAVLPLHRQKALKTSVPVEAPTFRALEAVCFLLVVLLMGALWGLLFTFPPWLSSDLDCTNSMSCNATTVGLSWTLTFGFSLPFLAIAKTVLRNIGRPHLLVFALLFYFTQFAGLPFARSGWWTLPFALMATFSLCVAWVAAVAYGQALAPQGRGLAVQYGLNMLHFGVGRGLGSLLGGTLLASYSHRTVFCGAAVVSAVAAILYLTTYHTVLKKRKKTNASALLNGSWYPLREHTNGDAKAPIVVDHEDEAEASPNHR